jgi:hypothetical protein
VAAGGRHAAQARERRAAAQQRRLVRCVEGVWCFCARVSAITCTRVPTRGRARACARARTLPPTHARAHARTHTHAQPRVSRARAPTCMAASRLGAAARSRARHTYALSPGSRTTAVSVADTRLR